MNAIQRSLYTGGLTRPTGGRILGGVCAGLARRLDTSPWAVRLLFLLSCLLPGPQMVVYALLWVAMPDDAATPGMRGPRY